MDYTVSIVKIATCRSRTCTPTRKIALERGTQERRIKTTTKSDIHAELVQPVCALEELCAIKNTDAIVDTVTRLLRRILNEIEEDIENDSEHGR